MRISLPCWVFAGRARGCGRVRDVQDVRDFMFFGGRACWWVCQRCSRCPEGRNGEDFEIRVQDVQDVRDCIFLGGARAGGPDQDDEDVQE